jgi:D-glycero-alpha-D-manno-heptose-7-phosphate kinase
LLLFYTKIQRDANEVLRDEQEQIRRDEKFGVLQQMVDMVYEVRDALRSGDLDRFAALLDRSWQLKRQMSGRISTPEIDDLYQRALAAGAEGGKLLGAGGGGFLLLYCKEGNQPRLREALTGFRELPFSFESGGTQIIYATDWESS